MKKSVILLLALSLLAIFLFNFISTADQTVSISPNSGYEIASKIYNISITNANATGDINEVRIDLYNLTVASSTSGSSTGISNSGSGNLFIFAGTPAIAAGTTQYFWFDISSPSAEIFKINVTSIDNQLIPASESENITLTISEDVTAPVIAFVSPTPADDDTQDSDYIEFNVSVDESGSGVKNVTLYIYGSAGLVDSQVFTSSPFFHNFTSLVNDIYHINATVYDNANNSDSTSTRAIEIVAGASSCLPEWSCSWTECINGTQTQTDCADANNCGFIAPAGTQDCESCISNWDCGDWIPAACSGDSNQTRLCTDLNSCEPPDTEIRTCVVGGASAANASGLLSIFSPTTLFFIILGLIAVSVLGVVIILIRLKKKSASANSGNSDSGYSVYSPPRGPPALPPPGYANSPSAYPSQPKNY
ncbi:MAG: hypothetical protein PHH00_01320 [Candidatus Nanoarchaeia archaeon]|nr:hypothetical protein [Candidatus Nanoarchaeia archaeon]